MVACGDKKVISLVTRTVIVRRVDWKVSERLKMVLGERES